MTQETVQIRNIRSRACVPLSKDIPTLDQLSVECRTAAARLQLHERAVSRSTEEALRGWLDQAERLAIVVEVHSLRGKAFETWAANAAMNPRRAYDVYKLNAYRDDILMQ